jgi:hypothetical protein
MRQLMRNWSVEEFSVAAQPERPDARALKIDRILAAWAGRIALWNSVLARARLRRFAKAVLALGPGLEALDDAGLQGRIETLRAALPSEGLSRRLAVEAFALVREVSRRRLGMAHYPVQLMGGYALLRGTVAEMATGEGKTLTGLLAGGDGRAGRRAGARGHGQRVPGAPRCAGARPGVRVLRPHGGLDRAGPGSGYAPPHVCL